MSPSTVEQLRDAVVALRQQVAQLAAVERPRVAGQLVARYTTDAAPSIPNNAHTLVDFATLSIDTHGAVATGASWAFTAPHAGLYRVSAMILFAATTGWADTETGQLSVYKNGARWSYLDYKASYGSASSVALALGGTDVVQLAAGDTLDIRVYQSSGASLALFASAQLNYVAIEWI